MNFPKKPRRMDNGKAHISQGSLCRLSFPILITSAYNYPASPLCRHSPQADLLLFPLIHQGPNLSLAHIQCNCSDIGMGKELGGFCNPAWPSGTKEQIKGLGTIDISSANAKPLVWVGIKGQGFNKIYLKKKKCFFSKFLAVQDLGHSEMRGH